MQFSVVFKMLCKEAGVSQKQALSDLRLGRNAAQRWVSGWPSFETLTKVSNYFSIPIDVLSDCMIADDDYVFSLFHESVANVGESEIKETPADPQINGRMAEFMALFDSLTPDNQEALLVVMRGMKRG